MTAVERFLSEHFTFNGISDARQREQRVWFTEFEAHAGRPLEQTGAAEFRAYLAHLLDARGLHVNTVRKIAGSIRPFYGWAEREGLVDPRELLRIREVRNPKGSSGTSLPRPYSRKDLDRFWRELDARWPLDADGHWTRRYGLGRSPYRRVWPHATRLQLNAIVHLALHGGLRRDEIYRADLDDLHYDNAFVVVQGAAKGAAANGGPRMREVPMTEALRSALWAWLELRTLLLSKFDVPEHGSPWLVLHPSASPANPRLPSSPANAMRHRAFAEQLSTVGAWELHRFRHTCGTEWLRAGMPLEQVSRLLGHATLQQTLGYAKVVRDDLHRSAQRAESEFTRSVSAAA